MHDEARTTSIRNVLRPAIQVALRYAAFSALWILFSDRILLLLVRDELMISNLQTLKGWFFVVVTSFLLYGLVTKELSILEAFRKATDEVRDRDKAILERALAERDALLREVHHRVKNNLQVVSSLMSLERPRLQAEADGRILDDLSTRVRAMSLVYDRLHRSESMDAVRLDDYVEVLFEALSSSSDGSMVFENRCDQVALGLDAAVPLGLLINELAINSIKYAGTNRTFTLSTRLEAGRLTLRASDDGRGFPSIPPLREGALGLVLVDNLARQLGGTIRYANSGGAVAELEFPIKPPAS